MHDGILCMHDGKFGMHDSILCMHDGMLCVRDGMLCMHDDMLETIDMLEMLCTLNLTISQLAKSPVCTSGGSRILSRGVRIIRCAKREKRFCSTTPNFSETTPIKSPVYLVACARTKRKLAVL